MVKVISGSKEHDGHEPGADVGHPLSFLDSSLGVRTTRSITR